MTEMSAARLAEIRWLIAESKPTAWSEVAHELLAEVDRRALPGRVFEIGSGTVDVPVTAGGDEIGKVTVPFVVKAMIMPFEIGTQPFEVEELPGG
jgi:hypothetical protein